MKIKKFVFFPAFKRVVPKDFENWLEKMAAEGWHIERIRQWSSMLMIFIKGEPKNYRYIYDLRAVASKDYILTYEQFGWQYLGRMASVYVWRMEYKDKRPEVFTDKDSITSRNNRTVAAVSFSFAIFLVATIVISVALIFFPSSVSPNDHMQLIIAAVLFGVFALTLGTVMILIHRASRQ
ncbi:MAG: DUF2812 domain-containing protein [Actinomycetota bacterium]|nr:DUF2812 domain-containing protein [Actinomycetota bacterium]